MMFEEEGAFVQFVNIKSRNEDLSVVDRIIGPVCMGVAL
jgi:hypothetical protein